MSGPRPALGFWAVAFAFLVVMMFATLPSPLYGLYRTRDHLSAFTITVVFAIFAVGTILTLLLEGRVAGRFGRRGAMLGGVQIHNPFTADGQLTDLTRQLLEV